jgi:hypothetical protein
MKSIFLVALTILANYTYAQSHICGMSTQDQLKAEEIFARSTVDSKYLSQRGDKLYIPVKFHIVSDNNGKGGATYQTLLNQLARLNNDYAKFNFVFYLKDNYNFNVVRNTNIQTLPRDNENLMATLVDPKAINVFVVKTIGSSGVGSGIVLGYYSPDKDFLVIQEAEAAKQSNTLSHEIGHFFNLKHTFFGWEANPYDENEHGNPCVLSLIPNTNIQVEKVDKSNCKNAADQLCDTPPDYNFGLTASGCVWTKIIKDKNGDVIVPMKNNHMSYFSDCSDFTFTAEQEDKMRGNYSLISRNFLKSSYVPVTDTLPKEITTVTPIKNQKFDVYTSAYFEWADQKASTYLLEVKNTSNSTEFYTFWVQGANSYTVTTLLPNKNYFWTVRAFHDGYTNTLTSPSIIFKTGNLMVSTSELDGLKSIEVYPNPLSQNQKTNLDINATDNDDLKITILDVTSKIIDQKSIKVHQGQNLVELDPLTNSGMYMVKIENKNGSITKKVMVQK